MLTRNEIKLINALSRKKERLEQQLFIVEGNKNIQEVLNSNFEVKQIYGIDEVFENEAIYSRISHKELERISQYKSSSEALALVSLPSDIKADFSLTSILLEDINDPGNLGTIIRTADWFGFKQIICSKQSVDCFNPKVVSAAKGSLFRVKVIYTELSEFISTSNIPTLITSLRGEDLTSSSNLRNHHIAFGSESHGISEDLENLGEKSIKIPSFNSNAESLNLGISVGIICSFIQFNGQ